MEEKNKCWCEHIQHMDHHEATMGETYIIPEAWVYKKTGEKTMNKKRYAIATSYCPMCGKKLLINCPYCHRPMG